MAERKRFTPVVKPDEDYTKRIERKPAAQKFMFREDAEEIEAPLETEPTKDDTPNAKAPPSTTLEPSDVQMTEGAAREPAAPKTARSVETPTTTAKLRLHIAVPAELAARANRAAEKARCPARKIALAALNEIKPSLLERLNSIRYGQIELERQENVGFSISTTWQIPAKTENHLKSELDPVGIGQVNRLVSHWIREQFLDHFEKYLKKLGY